MSICDPVTGMHSIYGNQLPIQLFTEKPKSGFEESIERDEIQRLNDFFEHNQHNMAAFIIEPVVQGAGGMRFYSPDYLKLIRELCHKYDILLIADEIAT